MTDQPGALQVRPPTPDTGSSPPGQPLWLSLRYLWRLRSIKTSPVGESRGSVQLTLFHIAYSHGEKEVYTTVPTGDLCPLLYIVPLRSGLWIHNYPDHGVFPLYFDPSTGHDETLYKTILKEAKCLRLCKLVVWLEQGLYKMAVDMSIDMEDPENRYGREETIAVPRVVRRHGGMLETDTMQVSVWRETKKKIDIREGSCSHSGTEFKR